MPEAQQVMQLTDDQSTDGLLIEAEKRDKPSRSDVKVNQEDTLVQGVSQPVPLLNQQVNKQDSNAPLCYNCGNQTQRAGSCYVCTSCGSTTGCS